MAKLYFRYGAMGSAKTLQLLAVAHNYRDQSKRVLLAKPALDRRFGKGVISSRAGLSAEADLLIDGDTNWDPVRFKVLDCVLVDEAQFLDWDAVDALRSLTIDPGVPVICYGLRTDFQGLLFPGSERLLAIADSIEEVKTTCRHCNRKATMNMRLQDGKPVFEGEQVQLGGDESYVPACFPCYHHRRSLVVRPWHEGPPRHEGPPDRDDADRPGKDPG